MEYRLTDLLDMPKIQELLDVIDAVACFPTGIVDNDGNVLTASGWQSLCTEFHRSNPETAKLCRESDRHILAHIHEANPSCTYECPMGIIDSATPIIVDGKHLGNVFIGQLFLDAPDIERFREQARRYGFEEQAYLEALSKLPVLTRDQLDRRLAFVRRFAELLSEIVLQRLQEERRLQELNENLGRSREELRALAGRLMSAREEENRRLARELHDVISQRLAVLGIELSVLQGTVGQSSTDVLRDDLAKIEAQINGLASEIRQFSRDLHATVLDDLGLNAVLRSECATFSKQHAVSAEFLSESVPNLLPHEVALTLYRIAQESLWNIAKHAQARRVWIALARVAGELVLSVEDDGRGFEASQTKGRDSLGLVSMEERARLVGGTFCIRSRPGQGTTVEVRIPFADEDRSPDITA